MFGVSPWIAAVVTAAIALLASTWWFGIHRRRMAENSAGVQALAGMKWRECAGLVLQAMAEKGYTELPSSRQPGDGDENYAARIARNPGDLSARLAFVAELAAREQWEEAMEQALEVVRRDRSFEDDAGRRALLDLFALLGSGDERVRRYRRELAAVLNR